MQGDFLPFFISHLHYSLLTVASGRCPEVMSALLMTAPSLPLVPTAEPTVSLADCFYFPLKSLQLETTNYQHVQSAVQRERERIQVRKCKCSSILLCYTVSFPAADSLLLHVRRFQETDPAPAAVKIPVLQIGSCFQRIDQQSVSGLRPSSLPTMQMLLLSMGSTSRPGVLITSKIH